MIERDTARELAMCALYRSGQTLVEIGNRYGMTRKRVRQLIKRHGLVGKHGGARVRARRQRANRDAAQDERYLAKYGCTVAQYKVLLTMGNPISVYRTPCRAFVQQANSAKQRGIPWHLKLWEWWQIWDASGKWTERGRGQGYCMARRGDEGAYETGNVFITSAINNASHAPKKKKFDLPLGVRQKKDKFIAGRMLGGKKHHIGTYETPDAAHLAYLNFAPVPA